MTNPVTRPTTIKLKQITKERIKRLAINRHHSPHWLILEAIEQYVDREEKREAVWQDAIKAWEHYQQTGLHVTFEEADKWLTQLAAGHKVDPPKCHN